MGFKMATFTFTCDYCGEPAVVTVHTQQWVDIPEDWVTCMRIGDRVRIVCSDDCNEKLVQAYKASALVAEAEFETRLAEARLRRTRD